MLHFRRWERGGGVEEVLGVEAAGLGNMEAMDLVYRLLNTPLQVPTSAAKGCVNRGTDNHTFSDVEIRKKSGYLFLG